MFKLLGNIALEAFGVLSLAFMGFIIVGCICLTSAQLLFNIMGL